MPRRIDIDGGDPQNEIEEALRQLTQRQRPEPEDDLERAVQEVAEQQRAAGLRRRPAVASPWPARIAWGGMAAVVVAMVVLAVVLTRPEPLPPPAASAEEAVRGFWSCIMAGRYEGATVYFPSMLQTYGTRRQAGQHLRELFANNPPVNLRRVDPPEFVAETNLYRVSYEVYMRSGLPKVGSFDVAPPANQVTGFVIVSGGL